MKSCESCCLISFTRVEQIIGMEIQSNFYKPSVKLRNIKLQSPAHSHYCYQWWRIGDSKVHTNTYVIQIWKAEWGIRVVSLMWQIHAVTPPEMGRQTPKHRVVKGRMVKNKCSRHDSDSDNVSDDVGLRLMGDSKVMYFDLSFNAICLYVWCRSTCDLHMQRLPLPPQITHPRGTIITTSLRYNCTSSTQLIMRWRKEGVG